MKKGILVAFLGLLVFVGSAIYHAPANLIHKFPIPNNIVVGELSGRLLSGEVASFAANGMSLGKVSWQWKPASLLSAELAFDVRFGQDSDLELQGRGVLGLSFAGAFARQMITSVPVEQVRKMLPPTPVPLSLQGDVELLVEEWVYQAPICANGEAKIVWNADTVSTPIAPLELGLLTTDVTCQNNQVNAKGGQDSEHVLGGLNAELNSSFDYQAQVWFEPKPAMPNALASQLRWLPPAQNGRYQFSFNGRLPM